MEGQGETDRLRQKTDELLVGRHLDWAKLERGQSFVDLGCGSGEVLLTAARLCSPGQAFGVDANPERLASVRRQLQSEALLNVEVLEASIVGCGSIGLPTGGFDHAWTRFFLEYLREPLGTVQEMVRLVRPGGRVTLIDIEGNCVWHHGMQPELRAGLDEVIGDLRQTGFDPHVGRRLPTLAREAGLVQLRHDIEPYHRIIGRPDDRAAEAWQRKIRGIQANYVGNLFPDKQHLAWVFDAYLEFLLREDTMTWSLLHLVQEPSPPLPCLPAATVVKGRAPTDSAIAAAVGPHSRLLIG